MVQPDALALPARRLPREESLGVGGHSQHAVRPAPGTLRLPRIHEPARVRRHPGLRRHRLQRASSERLRPHALAQPDRGRPGPAHLALRHLRDRQLHRLLQPAHPRGRGIRHARRDLGRPPGGGLPVGTPMDTNFCYGQIPALTRDKYREAHELIMKAWAEDEPFAFDGKYNQLRLVNCWPKPIQKPHPPIYIPGGGSIETWDFCLDFDYNYSYLSFFGYLRGKSLLDVYWKRVAKRGKDESPYRAAFAQIICVADTDAEPAR